MRRVAVAMGGPSEEHDVSIASGRAVVKGLRQAGMEVLPVWIRRDTSVVFDLPPGDGQQGVALYEGLQRLTDMDCVFIAMHGPFGEDGTLQAILESVGIPFTGSDHFGAAAAMDKVISKRIYEAVGLDVPPYRVLKSRDCIEHTDDIAKKTADTLGLPVVLKTPRLGSSVGVVLAGDMDELRSGLKELAEMAGLVLAERFIKGRELTVPVLQDAAGLRALPLIEIRVHSHAFFDYQTKYDPALADEVCPAPIPGEMAKRLSEAGIIAHEALMLSGFSRSDFIVDQSGRAWVLETNAIPGLTEFSLFPKAAAAAGMGFSELLLKICDSAVR